MNNKHLACVIVFLAAIVMAQGVLHVRKKMAAMQAESQKAESAAFNAANMLSSEKVVLQQLKSQSKSYLDYLALWEPYLAAVNTPESSEFNITSRVKKRGLIALAQRFEVVANKDSANIPRCVRAHLTFEDDYAKCLNWLGELEEALPTARVSNLKVIRGQAGNDLKMDLVVDIPLARSAEPSPTPAAP